MYLNSDTFVSVVGMTPLNAETVKLTMLRGATADVYNALHLKKSLWATDLYVALPNAAPRLKNLWQRHWEDQSYDWRLRLRAHIFRVITTHRLNVSMVTLDNVIRMLPEVEHPVMIHGDATLANCVYDPHKQGWFWIDPLTRPYIPGDPHVDLGKLFQSCFSYESIITDQLDLPRYQTELMLELTQLLKLDLKPALLWCIIHLVRLIPYQEERHRSIFEQQIKDVWGWI